MRNICDYLNIKTYLRYPIQFNLRMTSTVNQQNIFQGKTDRYEGITVFSEEESCGLQEFTDKLKSKV